MRNHRTTGTPVLQHLSAAQCRLSPQSLVAQQAQVVQQFTRWSPHKGSRCATLLQDPFESRNKMLQQRSSTCCIGSISFSCSTWFKWRPLILVTWLTIHCDGTSICLQNQQSWTTIRDNRACKVSGMYSVLADPGVCSLGYTKTGFPVPASSSWARQQWASTVTMGQPCKHTA